MLKLKNKSVKKTVKGAVIFIVAALILQVILITFMTTEGALGIYPYYLALRTEKIDTTDLGVGEYYPLRSVAENSDLIILAVDEGVADSFVLAADLMSFLEKFARISGVALYAPKSVTSTLSKQAMSGQKESFEQSVQRQRVIGVTSGEMLDFVERYFDMNGRMTPANKVPLIGIKGVSSAKSLMSEITNEIYLTPGATTAEHMELARTQDPVIFSELFRKYEDSLRNLFKNEYDKYAKLCDAMLTDSVGEAYAAMNIIEYRPEGEGAVFVVAPRSMCDGDSLFVKSLEESFESVNIIRCSYYDCETVVDGEVTVRDDGPYPFLFDGIRIASAKKLEGFRNYYSSLCDDLDTDRSEIELDRIGDAGKQSFFVICGSSAVTFGLPDKNETAVTTAVVQP